MPRSAWRTTCGSRSRRNSTTISRGRRETSTSRCTPRWSARPAGRSKCRFAPRRCTARRSSASPRTGATRSRASPPGAKAPSSRRSPGCASCWRGATRSPTGGRAPGRSMTPSTSSLHKARSSTCRRARRRSTSPTRCTPTSVTAAAGPRSTATSRPSTRDWLSTERGFVKSARARQKIRQWFNAKAMMETIAAGRAEVEKELRREGATQASLESLASRLGFGKPDDLFVAVARDEVNLRQLQTALRGEPAPPKEEIVKRTKGKTSHAGVLIVGMDRLLTQLARCCKPVPPDPIRGFVTRGKGVSVHREDCAGLKRLAEVQPERLIDAEWGKGEGSYTVGMTVTAADRRGLLRDIGDALARERINVTAVRTQSRDELAFMRFTFDVANVGQLKRAFTVVRSLKGVIRVARG